MILHPLADDFLQELSRETGAWARPRRQAFLRICEACSDPQGLPTLSGLRRLESGAWNARLGDEWRPVFVDVYRRWIGFRMEREFLEPERPLSLRWWFTAPAIVRSRLHGTSARLFSPAAGMALLLLLVAGLGLGPALSQHERRIALEAAIDRHELARDRLAAAERELQELLERVDDEALEEVAARRPVLESLGEHATRERALLAERAGVRFRSDDGS